MFLITMAGLSSRFFKAGYTQPKYKLMVHGESVFSLATKSFLNYFKTDLFIFVIRDIYDTKKFITEEIRALGITNYKIVSLDHETRGQAETAYIALKQISSDEQVTIFNIDTFRHNYLKPNFTESCDGYLEVFTAEGDHWSFVEAAPGGKVSRTTEKERISDLCSDGLYHFKHKEIFINVFEEALLRNEVVRGEYYVAPLYNRLIQMGMDIRYETITLDQIDFCGTPEEYQALTKQQPGEQI
ncbi:glycosyltransferase family 2 protein [Pseudomonas sp. CLCA07]